MPRSPLRGLPPGEQTLPALLDRQAAVWGRRRLLRAGGAVRTYAAMLDAVTRRAGMLGAEGIHPGDRLALLCENSVDLLDLILACGWIGAAAVPLNAALRGEQLAHQLRDCGAAVLAGDAALLPQLGGIGTRPQALERIWRIGGTPGQNQRIAGLGVEDVPQPGPPAPPHPVRPGDTLAVLYTSGTTGPAKGVMCPHAQFYWWGVLMGEQLGLDETDVLHTCLPLSHTNALNAFSQALLHGATYDLGPRFSVSRCWPRARAAGATVTFLLGAMVAMLMSSSPGPQDRDHGVRRALAPGTPVAMFEAFFERFGVRLVEGYGSTETNAVIGAPWTAQRAGWMGYVREGFEARVVDEDDAEVPPDVPGELVVRHSPPFAFATGYFGRPQATVEAWRNLWFHTGDRVVRDEDGRFRFLDRLKDAIRRRGENISSYEVEQVLQAHPDVVAAAVYPIPSELAEEEVAAALVAEPGATLDPAEVIRFSEPHLATFAVPRYVRVVERLPLTANGKVRKTVLRELGLSGKVWDRLAPPDRGETGASARDERR